MKSKAMKPFFMNRLSGIVRDRTGAVAVVLLLIVVSLLAAFMLMRRKIGIGSDVYMLRSRPISLTLDSMECYVGTERTRVREKAGCHRLVVYTDSIQCNSCALTALFNWDELVDTIQSCYKECRVCFVFTPPVEERIPLTTRLLDSGFLHPVYVDRKGLFPRENPHIPANPMMHAFLTDSAGKVVLVGNPFNNKRIMRMVLDYLNEEK